MKICHFRQILALRKAAVYSSMNFVLYVFDRGLLVGATRPRPRDGGVETLHGGPTIEQHLHVLDHKSITENDRPKMALRSGLDARQSSQRW